MKEDKPLVDIHTIIYILSLLPHKKIVTECGVSNFGIQSDNSAVYIIIRIHYVKFKSAYKAKLVIYWKQIKSDFTFTAKYNEILSHVFQHDLYYTGFNKRINECTNKTATTKKYIINGCFNHNC